MKEKKIISFLVSKREFELLDRIAMYDEDIATSLKLAKKKGDKYQLKFSYDLLDELLGFLAAEANHEKSKRREEELDRLYDKIEELMNLMDLLKIYRKTKPIKPKGRIKSDVYIFDVWLKDIMKPSKRPLRRIAVLSSKSLYHLAETIVSAFDFCFDHCFGFYSNLKKPYDSEEAYELFVDIGEEPTRPHIKGVKRTKISKVFNVIGKKMLFLFDYGDNWHFIVELKDIRKPTEGEILPAVIESKGKSPQQYPDYENES